MIDSHTHLYLPDFKEDIENVMSASIANGITHFILPNIDAESIILMKDFHKKYSDVTTMTMGLHPTEVRKDWQNVITNIETELFTGQYKGVGEIGIDLYWDKQYEKEQKDAFYYQIQLACQQNLPVIIHSRSAFREIIDIIKIIKPSVPLIFHSFTGNIGDVKLIKDVCDPYFGINGVVTFKNAKDLRESLHEISIEKLLLETDSPYLSPSPFRGKRNDSSYLVYIRDKIGEVLDLSPQEVEIQTDINTRAIFQI